MPLLLPAVSSSTKSNNECRSGKKSVTRTAVPTGCTQFRRRPLAGDVLSLMSWRSGPRALLREAEGGSPANWPRRTNQSIPLLPSGPGGVFNLSSRGASGATIETIHHVKKPSVSLMVFKIWRRKRDSNPRYGFKPYTHFPGVLLKPLGHLSAELTDFRGEPVLEQGRNCTFSGQPEQASQSLFNADTSCRYGL